MKKVIPLFLLIIALTLTMTACKSTPTEAPTEVPSEAPQATPTPKPTGTPELTDTPEPTKTPHPTDTPAPTDTPQPTNTPQPKATPRPAGAPAPADTPLPGEPTATSAPTPPSDEVAATFLTDARQTLDDLMEIKIWFDRWIGGEFGRTEGGQPVAYCSTMYLHTIHVPSSTAPAQVPELAATWNEYQVAIAEGQEFLQWLVDICDQNIGAEEEFRIEDFFERRELSASALSHCEHVVQALEAGQ
jgi:hypothetical protein